MIEVVIQLGFGKNGRKSERFAVSYMPQLGSTMKTPSDQYGYVVEIYKNGKLVALQG